MFGEPPRQLSDKAEELTFHLLAQMKTNEEWPNTLKEFISVLQQIQGTNG